MPAVDIRPLVYNLCQERKVPWVATDFIAGYLVERDIFTISTLSHNLHDQASPIIYHDVVLELGEAASFRKRAVLLLRTLLTSRTAASDIRSLSITGDPLSRWRKEVPWTEESMEACFRKRPLPEILFDLSPFTPREIELYKRLTSSLPLTDCQISLPRLCLDTIGLCTLLQHLHIGSDYFRYPDFRSNLRGMVALGNFQDLQSSNLCLDVVRNPRRHIAAVSDWEDSLITPFLVTDIKSIAAVMTLKPETISQLRLSSLARLVLHHCQIQKSDLNGLLATTPRLCYLEYHASVDYGWLISQKGPRHSLGLEPLFDALHHVSVTLKELVTSQVFDEDCPHFQHSYCSSFEPPFRQREELSKLKHLHTLSIPYASLLGWTRKDQNWEWGRILPTSLRQITLTDHLTECCLTDCWTDESLVPVITSMLDWLATCRQGKYPSKFGLLLLRSDTDFNEPVRRTLSLLCEEHGVLCSIKKHLADRPKRQRLPMLRGRGRGRGRG
ncbi:hypothetical protein K431DRAFT_130320 [Polychaeton citri CBS 116435]|uniref:Uncharacterized protein n=1 Tax=Polychaeton citri CBS 116435 TaxID=1314669 RepID=A0A9P4ULJ1_9PEZI|nr:hypothetical protein K431DRAFT_130320 [Polychaeton citri CBS 116435]